VVSIAVERRASSDHSGRIRALPLNVPKGQNMNSRGRQPMAPSQNTFDPAGVAHSLNRPPWVCTHGYLYLAASRSERQVECRGAPGRVRRF